jgi:hypothetical protein
MTHWVHDVAVTSETSIVESQMYLDHYDVLEMLGTAFSSVFKGLKDNLELSVGSFGGCIGGFVCIGCLSTTRFPFILNLLLETEFLAFMPRNSTLKSRHEKSTTRFSSRSKSNNTGQTSNP